MCNRFWCASEVEFAGVVVPGSEAKGAPEEQHLTIHLSHKKRAISKMRWGIGGRDKPPVIHAWAEGMLQADLLARHVREQRCLIPVRGYYECPKGKEPHLVQLKNQPTFALAGVWREFVGQKQFVVVTTRPNSLIKPIHDRMPCLVSEDDFGLWLEGNCEEALAKVCVPFPSDAMTATPVTRELELLEPKVVQSSLF